MYTTELVTCDIELTALMESWNALAAGEPMRSWNWHSLWWKHYGAGDDSGRLSSRELYVIAVLDHSRGPADEIIGIAPWYIERSAIEAVIRPLGSGHVCTDHLSLLCRAEVAHEVANAVAEHLAAADDWDRLELSAVDPTDASIGWLVSELQSRECLLSEYPAGNCWLVELSSSWNDYLAALSQSHRRQVRRCHDQMIGSGRSQRHTVKTSADFDHAWSILVNLHQARRNSLGEPGCFASTQFHDFHRELAATMLAKGQLRLSWIELDGSPFAAEYQLYAPRTIYAYQGGIDPDRLRDAPGRLANTWTLKAAVEEGYRYFDFLRGDEAYKAHLRAVPKPIVDYRVLPNRPVARLRGRLLNTATTVKQWMKQGVELVTS